MVDSKSCPIPAFLRTFNTSSASPPLEIRKSYFKIYRKSVKDIFLFLYLTQKMHNLNFLSGDVCHVTFDAEKFASSLEYKIECCIALI